MGDSWVERFAEDLRKKQEAARVADELTLLRWKMIEAQAPLLWQGLCKMISEKARAVNSQVPFFTCTAPSLNEYEIQSSSGRLLLSLTTGYPMIRFKFTKTPPSPYVEMKSIEGVFMFRVFNDQVALIDGGSERFATYRAAEHFLKMLA